MAIDKKLKEQHKLRVEDLIAKEKLKPSQKDTLSKMIDSPDMENLDLAEEIISLNIKDALKVGLNDDQQKAFDDILAFIDNPVEDAFVLKGYAGTGKTFLVKRIIEFITSTYSKEKIAITAPTNKAVRVLQLDAPFNTEEGRGPVLNDVYGGKARLNYSTVHKLLGLKENISDTGVQSFAPDPRDKNDITKYKFLIVDEVSMLDDQICNAIMKHKESVMIIYMGE